VITYNYYSIKYFSLRSFIKVEPSLPKEELCELKRVFAPKGRPLSMYEVLWPIPVISTYMCATGLSNYAARNNQTKFYDIFEVLPPNVKVKKRIFVKTQGKALFALEIDSKSYVN
jgi:hypothetical protein